MMSDFLSQTSRRRTWLVVSIIAGVGVFYFSTIRQADGWADFAQYLHHAKNIADGEPYTETGYLHNPFYSPLGPPAYPPVFPILLSFVYRLVPDNLTALRIEMVSILLITLWVLYLNFRRLLPWKFLLAALLLIAFNPQFWEYKDKMVSDIPFVLFTYLSLLVIDRCYEMKETPGWWPGLLTGCVLYLAYGTRSIGLVLVASLLIYDVLRNRKVTAFAVSATMLFLFLAGLQMIYLPGIDYKERIARISATNTLTNVITYAKYGSYFWDNGYSKVALHVVSAALFFFLRLDFCPDCVPIDLSMKFSQLFLLQFWSYILPTIIDIYSH